MKTSIISIVALTLNQSPEKITEQTNLLNDLNADSLDVMDIALAIEEKFNISFEDADYQQMKTIKDICDVVERKTTKTG